MSETVFLKLGGSLITDKTQRETARLDVLARLAGEIAQARAERPALRLLVGHGSGSFGHFAGREYGTRGGIVAGAEARSWYGYAATGAAAARLNRLVTDAMLAAGLPAVAFQPSASAACEAGELRRLAWEPIAQALGAGLLPIVYGDVALDSRQGCTIISTEQIFAYLARHLAPARILLAGVVDGVFDSDPLRQPAARRLPRLRAADVLAGAAEPALGGSHGVDVTGGMASKVREMAALAAEMPGLVVQFLSGEPAGQVRRALLEPAAEIGTRLAA
jgi:isopentenyl phosphate kinase